MPDSYVVGLPGIRAAKTATHKIIFKQGDWLSDLALGKIIDGVNSRDPTGNAANPDVLTAGLLMGKITATGLYAPSVLGRTTLAYTSGGTSLTVPVATALEIVRRIGASGTFNTIGPPSANGSNATTLTTFSAVNTTTGVITVTSLGVNVVTGALISPTDGSQTIKTLCPDGYGIKVTDVDGVTNLSVQFPQFPIAGVIISTQIVDWPADTSIQAYIIAALNAAAGGQFVFDTNY